MYFSNFSGLNLSGLCLLFIVLVWVWWHWQFLPSLNSILFLFLLLLQKKSVQEKKKKKPTKKVKKRVKQKKNWKHPRFITRGMILIVLHASLASPLSFFIIHSTSIFTYWHPLHCLFRTSVCNLPRPRHISLYIFSLDRKAPSSWELTEC